MIRSVTIAMGMTACLLVLGWTMSTPLEGWVRAPLWVGVGIGMATLLFGELSWLAVLSGAISPLAPSLIEGSLAWALFGMSLVWLAPRFVLARTREHLAVLVLVSIVAAAVVARVTAPAFVAELPWRLAACLFAAAALALTTALVPADTPTAFALSAAAGVLDEPLRGELQRAATLHRQLAGGPAGSARVAWRRLVKLADERASLQKRTEIEASDARGALDTRIGEVLSELAPEPRPAPPPEPVAAPPPEPPPGPLPAEPPAA
jgi:hypothetical protein